MEQLEQSIAEAQPSGSVRVVDAGCQQARESFNKFFQESYEIAPWRTNV